MNVNEASRFSESARSTSGDPSGGVLLSWTVNEYTPVADGVKAGRAARISREVFVNNESDCEMRWA